MAAANILQEYLISLGFLVDERSSKKADDRMLKINIRAKEIAKGVLAAGVAVQAFVAVYAYQMEKMYYASKKTESTVGNLQALEFGFKQVGGQSGAITSAMEGMARALRASPGLTGLLEQLGVPVRGRDKADVMMDLVKSLKSMPFYVAQQYAGLFGIDPDTLHLLTQGLDKMEKAQALRKQMAADAGLDLDKAAEAGMEYANLLSEIGERFGILKDMVGVKLLPVFKDWAESTNRILADLTKILGKASSLGDLWDRLGNWFKSGNPNGAVTLNKDARQRLDQMGVEEPKAGTWVGRLFQQYEKAKRADDRAPKPVNPSNPNSEVRAYGDSRAYSRSPDNMPRTAATASNEASLGAGKPNELFDRLEAAYKLPAGLLDKIWKKESNRGDPRYMRSPVGAQGHFQFMPATAKQYGLEDPNDLAQSAKAAARFLSDLLRKYKGDLDKAAAAYNWGPGNVDRKGLGRAPAETRDYVKAITGKDITLNQNNVWNISGSDAGQVADRVAAVQDQGNSALVRDMKQRVY
jgi:hypothetical protein